MRIEKKVKGWDVVIETDDKPHGLKKNKNRFCKGCASKDDCLKGRMAMIAHCEDYHEK